MWGTLVSRWGSDPVKVKKRPAHGVPSCGSAEMNLTSILEDAVHEDASLIPGISQWVKDLVLP